MEYYFYWKNIPRENENLKKKSNFPVQTLVFLPPRKPGLYASRLVFFLPWISWLIDQLADHSLWFSSIVNANIRLSACEYWTKAVCHFCDEVEGIMELVF